MMGYFFKFYFPGPQDVCVDLQMEDTGLKTLADLANRETDINHLHHVQ